MPYTTILKPNTYLTPEELGDWLKIKPEKYKVDDVTDPIPSDISSLRRQLEMFINIATARVEAHIQTAVIARAFTEDFENDDQPLVPSKWPVVAFTEIKVNNNPDIVFNIATDAVLRGFADSRQATSDVALRVVGSDIELVTDNYEGKYGRLQIGRRIDKMRVVYNAGWANDAEDVPWDLKHATLLMAEYYYFQRDNRDLGMISKGIRGESYSKVKDGVPDTIIEILAPYKMCR